MYDSLAENPIIRWISENGRILLWILLAVLALALLLHRFFGSSSAGVATDYVQAEIQYNAFANGTDTKAQKEALDKLATLMKRHPDLQSKYEGLLAQILLDRDNLALALPYANKTLERTGKDRLPYFHDYAQTSLLMAEKKYPEALKAAQALQQQLNEAPSGDGEMLYAFNLLRLAILQQLTGTREEELAAWQTLKQAALQHPHAFDAMARQLGEGQVTLMNYIELRERL